MLHPLVPGVGKHNIGRVKRMKKMGRIKEIEKIEGIKRVEETIAKIEQTRW